MKQNTKTTWCKEIYNGLFEEYGPQKCPLIHSSPFQLLIAVILSAQCTDKQVNKITKKLFKHFPTPEKLARAALKEVEKIIKPLGLYRNKSKNIISTSKKIIDWYNGDIPNTIEELTKLNGIGRKSANVIIFHLFGLPGFAVDTHVNRILNRIGIVKTHDPNKIEIAIRKILAPKLLGNFSLLLINHGRLCCNARKPNCNKCKINNLCKKYI